MGEIISPKQMQEDMMARCMAFAKMMVQKDQMGGMNPQMMKDKGGPMGGQIMGKDGLAPTTAQTGPGAALTAAALAAAPQGGQKQMLDEKLSPAISKHQPEQDGKITGMMGKSGPMGDQMMGKGGLTPLTTQTGPGAALSAA
eukprot:735303-Heterocapsa_arctica.AAC.1